ncbi:hypothetical protein [Lactiplantibacillus plantarum]|uniref:Uncharacterized protein orfZ2 n=1 Tax=Lactiplantibacillus plantarum TaxID=1590 RepID=A6XB83_LACPN|nr:hypothetical protein [Lactiplantibacillus plantarum]ABS11214.1 unknown protein [Lactiplantibacillus plantarum]MCG0634771.1 hypothetical protein [Lactiplantibacillus plantarum]
MKKESLNAVSNFETMNTSDMINIIGGKKNKYYRAGANARKTGLMILGIVAAGAAIGM